MAGGLKPEHVDCPKKCGAVVYKVVRPSGAASFEDRKVEERPWRSFAGRDFKAATWYSDTDPAADYQGVHRCRPKV